MKSRPAVISKTEFPMYKGQARAKTSDNRVAMPTPIKIQSIDSLNFFKIQQFKHRGCLTLTFLLPWGKGIQLLCLRLSLQGEEIKFKATEAIPEVTEIGHNPWIKEIWIQLHIGGGILSR